MRVTLKLNRVGMSMEEATISRWCREPGEAFAAGDALYEFETEKLTQEVTATAAGTLVEQCVPEGTNLAVGERVCVVEVDSWGTDA
jgi:pyruvate/2-oxoglutarate dehydrogenase complex dihydrolipoamide acyltransferase (E2) component